MMWSKLNKADKTLLTAAVLFLFFLCLTIEYPTSTFAQGLLFCSEAALVGGIADWFAVTAIFEKPLGFPYHTAILPRRREQFIEATGAMLQKEFFSRKKLLSKVKKVDFVNLFAQWLSKEKNTKFVADKIQIVIEDMKNKHGDKLAVNLKERFDNYPVVDMLQNIGKALQEEDSQQSSNLASKIFSQLRDYADTPKVLELIEGVLDNYQNKKMQNMGGFGAMMAGFAQSMNMVNIPEAAMLAQKQLLILLDNLSDSDSNEQKKFLLSVGDGLIYLAENSEKKQAVQALWQEIISQETIEKNIINLKLDNNGLVDFSETVVKHWLDLIVKEEKLHTAVNNLFYYVAARSVLQAQDFLADIVRQVLSTLTDKQINHLVYDKVEPDLLWIRMNGSIVGASIGFVIFTLMHLLS